MDNSLNKKVGEATKWSTITEIAAKLVAPLTNAILARLLAPEVFGVVATLTLVVSFAEIFTDAGFQKYIVQHEFSDQEDLDLSTNVAFWTNLVFSLCIWLLISLFVKPIAAMVGSSGYESAIIVMSAQIPLLAFSSIQMARYRRDFDFKNLFYARMAVAFVPVFITIPVALFFRSHWAIVIGTLSRDVLNAIILTVRSKWKPSFHYDVKKLQEMLAFSMWTMVENVTLWLTSNIGIFILSSTLSAYYMGLFKTSISTGNAYMSIITASTTPVLFSALSRSQNDQKQFREVFFKFQRMVALFVFPLGIGAFVYRDLATLILLGSQWTEAADFLGLWFLTSALMVVFSNYNSEAYRSLGKPKLSILVQLLHLAALIPTLLWGAAQSYDVMTLARALVRLQMIVVSAFVMQIVVRMRFVDILKNVFPVLIAAIIMGACGYGMQFLSDSLIWQFVSVLICVILYAFLLLVNPAGRVILAEVPLLKRLLRIKSKFT